MFCTNCGERLAGGEQFCGVCGSPTAKMSVPVERATEAPSAVLVYAKSDSESGGSPKNVIPPATVSHKRPSILVRLGWQVSEADFLVQTTQYRTLSFWKSFRGQGALLLVSSGVLTCTFDLMGRMARVTSGELLAPTFLEVASVVAYDFGIDAALAVFVARGQRWAMAAGLVWWTVGKLMLVADPHIGRLIVPPVNAIASWALFLPLLIRPLRVEMRRRREGASEDAS